MGLGLCMHGESSVRPNYHFLWNVCLILLHSTFRKMRQSSIWSNDWFYCISQVDWTIRREFSKNHYSWGLSSPTHNWLLSSRTLERSVRSPWKFVFEPFRSTPKKKQNGVCYGISTPWPLRTNFVFCGFCPSKSIAAGSATCARAWRSIAMLPSQAVFHCFNVSAIHHAASQWWTTAIRFWHRAGPPQTASRPITYLE